METTVVEPAVSEIPVFPKLKLESSALQEKVSVAKQQSQSLWLGFELKNNLPTAAHDQLLQLYLRMKADSRVYLNLVLVYGQPDDDEGAIEGTNTANINRTQLIEYSLLYNEFMEKFNIDFNQVLTTISDKIGKLYEIIEYKDKIYCKLLSIVLNQLGAGTLIKDTNTTLSSLSSKELSTLVNYIKTIDSIVKRFRTVELTKAEINFISTIDKKIGEIKQLRFENNSLKLQFEDATKRLQLFAVEGYHQQIISNQHRDITDLHRLIEKTEKEKEGIQAKMDVMERERLVQDDLIQWYKSQLEHAKLLYEKDIVVIQPILEKHIQSTQNDCIDIGRLRIDLEMKYNRTKVVEEELEILRSDHQQLQAKYTSIAIVHEAELKLIQDELAGCKSIIESQQLEFHNKITQFDSLLEQHEGLKGKFEQQQRDLNETAKNFDIVCVELEETEAYVKELQEIIERKEKKFQEMEQKYFVAKAELVGQEMTNKKLRQLMEGMNKSGLDSNKQMILNEREVSIGSANEENTKLQKQLKIALNQIQYLQDRLQMGSALNSPLHSPLHSPFHR